MLHNFAFLNQNMGKFLLGDTRKDKPVFSLKQQRRGRANLNEHGAGLSVHLGG